MLFRPLRCTLSPLLNHFQRRTLANATAGPPKRGAAPAIHTVPAGALAQLTPAAVLADRRALLARAPPPPPDDTLAEQALQRTRGARLVVSGLPTGVARGALAAQLAEAFGRYGAVRAIGTGGDGSALDGHAYVEFQSAGSAAKALQACALAKVAVAGVRPAVVYAARGLETLSESRVLRAALPAGRIDLEALRAWVGRHGMAVVWPGHYRSIAFIKYTFLGEATRAMRAYKESPIIMNNVLLELTYTSSREVSKSKLEEKHKSPPAPSAEICVMGSDELGTEQNVRAVFARFGEIQSVFIKNPAGVEGRQYVYVRFATQAQATAVVDAWRNSSCTLPSAPALEAWRHGTLTPGPAIHFVGYSTRLAGPTHRLRVTARGCTADELHEHLRAFTPFIWRVARDPRPGTHATYVDFDTAEHAAAARAALDGRTTASGGGRIAASFVAPFVARNPLPAADADAAAAFEARFRAEFGDVRAEERDMALRLFREVAARRTWAVQRLLPHYLGAAWEKEFGGAAAEELPVGELAMEVLRRRARLVEAEEAAAAKVEAEGAQGGS